MSPLANQGPSSLLALGFLLQAEYRRLRRMGNVRRALAWPALILMVSLCGTAVLVNPQEAGALRVALPQHGAEPGELARMEGALELLGMVTLPVADPAELLAKNEADMALIPENRGWVLRSGASGLQLLSGRRIGDELRVEAAIREVLPVAWRLVVPADQERDPSSLGRLSGTLARILGLLAALFALVLGAALPEADRASAVWELRRTAPIHPSLAPLAGTIAAGLVAGLSGVMGVAMVACVLPLGEPLQVGLRVLSGGLIGGALGSLSSTGFPPGPPRSLLRALPPAGAAATGLFFLGITQEWARILPIAGLAGVMKDPELTLGNLAVAMLTVGIAGWAAGRARP
jgi:hypothetical protein